MRHEIARETDRSAGAQSVARADGSRVTSWEPWFSSIAPVHIERRWLRSHATRWDYRVTHSALLEELKPKPRDRVLEIGCGPGTWTREIAMLSKEVVAVDISASMIEEARKRTHGLPVTYIHSDFLSCEPRGKFDKIFAVRSTEYIADRDLLARKAAELLAPGGTVVIITKTRFSIWRGRLRLLNLRTGLSADREGTGTLRPRQYHSSPQQLARAFKPYGLYLTRVRPVVFRPPVFREGFHEVPIIPDSVAKPCLDFFSLLHRVVSRTPRALVALPLLLSESYCITLKSPKPALPDEGIQAPS